MTARNTAFRAQKRSCDASYGDLDDVLILREDRFPGCSSSSSTRQRMSSCSSVALARAKPIAARRVYRVRMSVSRPTRRGPTKGVEKVSEDSCWVIEIARG